MRIPAQLPQFKQQTVLMVVMGTHHGVMYVAKDGVVELFADVRVSEPEYSDNEGLFMRGGGGKTYSIGSVLEPKKQESIAQFSKEMVLRMKEAYRTHGTCPIVLFAPPRMKQSIEHDWTAEMRGRIQERFDGNYVAESPRTLLEMIADRTQSDSKKSPATGDAKKLLGKTDDIH